MTDKIKVSEATLRELREAYRAYCDEVMHSNLSLKSQQTYTIPVGNFIRWIEGTFAPSERLR